MSDATLPPYPKILQWSVEKISESRRHKSGIDLRRNLLIANVIYKARSSILQMRTKQFLQAKPQLQPPAPKEPETTSCQQETTSCQQETTSCQQEPASCQQETTSCQQEPTICQQETTRCQQEPTSCQQEPTRCQEAAGSCQRSLPRSQGRVDLSASAEAIVLSSVQLSIQGIDDDCQTPDSEAAQPQAAAQISRKRRRRRHRRPAPLQLQQQQQQQQQDDDEVADEEQQDTEPTLAQVAMATAPHSPPKRGRFASGTEVFVLQNSGTEEVFVLQNSFLDLSVAAEQPPACTSDPFALFGCLPSLSCPS